MIDLKFNCYNGSIEMFTYFSFGLILQDMPNSITPQNTNRLLPIPVRLLVLPCTCQCRQSLPYSLPSPFFSCSRQRNQLRPVQQLALNVHVKHSDLQLLGAKCSSMVEHLLMVRLIIGPIHHSGPIERFLAPQVV